MYAGGHVLPFSLQLEFKKGEEDVVVEEDAIDSFNVLVVLAVSYV